MEFSVLMSVYIKEKPQYLKEALQSVFDQTVVPTEVVVVKDGVLTDELERVISFFKKERNI